MLVATLGGPALATWTWEDAAKIAHVYVELPAQPVELGGDRPRAWLVLTRLFGRGYARQDHAPPEVTSTVAAGRLTLRKPRAHP